MWRTPPFYKELAQHVYSFLPEEFAKITVDGIASSRSASFRINTLKCTDNKTIVDEVQQRFKSVSVIQCPWYENAYILDGIAQHSKAHTYLQAFSQNWIYMQTLSSMLPVMCMNLKPDHKVLDICAAPGGKTTLIAELISNQGYVLANDNDRKRISMLENNLAKLLPEKHCITVSEVDGKLLVVDADGKPEDGKVNAGDPACNVFDRILVDVPCTGSGRYSSDPKSWRIWESSFLAVNAIRQKRLLHNAFQMLKPGGLLIYSSASLSPEENEEVIDWLLKHVYNVKLCEVVLSKSQRGLVGALNSHREHCAIRGLLSYGNKKFNPEIKKCVRILPSNFYEGYFVCALQKLAPSAQNLGGFLLG